MTTRTSPFRYRTIDLLVIVMIGVAFGVAFAGYAMLYTVVEPLTVAFPPAVGLLTGFWCLPALLALLIVRKPGAALGAELIAAALELMLGSKFSVGALASGLIQGLGFEIVFALARFGSVALPVVIGGSLLSTFFEWLYEIAVYYPTWSFTSKALLLGCFWISALVLLAGLGLVIVKALASTGALNSFEVGREASRAKLGGSDVPEARAH